MPGLLSFRCVARVPRGEWDERGVRACMIPRAEVPVLREDEPAIEALGELSENRVGRGSVLGGGRPVGLLAFSDLARALQLGPAPSCVRASTRPAVRRG